MMRASSAANRARSGTGSISSAFARAAVPPGTGTSSLTAGAAAATNRGATSIATLNSAASAAVRCESACRVESMTRHSLDGEVDDDRHDQRHEGTVDSRRLVFPLTNGIERGVVQLRHRVDHLRILHLAVGSD